MRVMPIVIYCNWYFCYYLLLQDEDALTATSKHQDRSEQDKGNVDENKEVHAVPLVHKTLHLQFTPVLAFSLMC